MRIQQLHDKTAHGYSWDAYGESGWRGAIRELKRRKWNDRQIVAFMLSKHTRWAGDGDNVRRYGRYNGRTIANYLGPDDAVEWDTELETLVNGTPEAWDIDLNAV